jgi:hypothetical protein
MAASPLNSTTPARRSLLALIAILAFFASACAGTSTIVAETDAPSSTAAETSADGAVTEDADDKFAAPADDAAVPAGSARNMTQVLAFAMQAAEQESYTFTQGLVINIGAAGGQSRPAAPYAFGEVVDGQTHVRVDLEAFVAESMGSLAGFGLGPTGLEGQQFEVWATNTTLTMDLSDLDIADADLQALADGPVSVDIAAIDGVDVSAVAQQFGQGSQVTDPVAMFDALRSITDAIEEGPGIVGDVPVTTYVATLSVADFYAAQGGSIGDQLSVIENLGLADNEADAIAGLVPALESVELDVQIMVDDDGHVRRVASELNMTDLVVALFENSTEFSGGEGAPPIDLGALFGPDGLQIILGSWQEFHDYGSAPAIVVPDAVDVTDQLNVLFDDATSN